MTSYIHQKIITNYIMNPSAGLEFVNLTFVYINKINEICKINNDLYFFSPGNTIPKNDLISLLRKHKINDGTEYVVMTILKYNVTNDVPVFVEIKTLDDVSFLTSEHYISDLNEVLFLFVDKTIDKTNNNQTKRIFMHSISKNTRRHRIKK
jgi:hypothetical protein